MSSVRDRAIARIKTLAAAGVVVGCGGSGYGVVDPMPTPACFDNPQRVITAKILETTDDGTRVVEIVMKFQDDNAKFTELGVWDNRGGKVLDITEQTINKTDLRAVVRVPKAIREISFNGVVHCDHGNGFSIGITVEETTVTVTAT